MLLDSEQIGNLDLIPSGSFEPDPCIYGFPGGFYSEISHANGLVTAFSGPGTRCVQYGITIMREDRYLDKLEVTVDNKG